MKVNLFEYSFICVKETLESNFLIFNFFSRMLMHSVFDIYLRHIFYSFETLFRLKQFPISFFFPNAWNKIFIYVIYIMILKK